MIPRPGRARCQVQDQVGSVKNVSTIPKDVGAHVPVRSRYLKERPHDPTRIVGTSKPLEFKHNPTTVLQVKP